MSILVLQRYLAVGAILFVIGLIGFMTRRNLIVLFLSTELMFQGIAVNFIAFGRYHMGEAFFHGQAFVVFLLVIAAASFEMIAIPGGSFLMGSPKAEKGRKDAEGPQHPVGIKPLWVGKCEVTKATDEPLVGAIITFTKDGKFTLAHTPLMSMSRTRASTS